MTLSAANKAIWQVQYRHTIKGSAYTSSQAQKYHQLYPQKKAAKDAVYYAVKHGLIIKPKFCPICLLFYSSRLIQGHHFDYSKPLEVIWCCSKCHKLIGRDFLMDS